jgi:hypothetical protein
MTRTTLLSIIAVFVVAGGAVILAQNTTVDHSASEGTRVEAPGTKVETDGDKTRIQAPGVDITVPKDKDAD